MSLERDHASKDTLLYGGIALGALLGATAATWLWRQRMQELEELNASPLDRAEDIIASVEDKLASIEKAVAEIQQKG